MVRHDDEQTPWVADQTVGDALRITASRFPDRDALVFPALGSAVVVGRVRSAGGPRGVGADRPGRRAAASTSASGR